MSLLADLNTFQIVVTVLAVVVGALTQSTLGIGFGIIMVPVMAVVAPDLLPAMPLLLATLLSLALIRRERSSVDLSGLPPLMVGRVLGTVAAVWLLVSLSGPALEILFGVVIVVVVLVSATRPSIEPNGTAKFIGGATSGLFATTAGIGGPPVAILYQSRTGPEVRSTLAVIFLMGGVMSLVGLIPAGRMTWGHLVLALVFLIPTGIGFALSGPLARYLEGRWLRPGILLFATAGGVMAIVRGLSG